MPSKEDLKRLAFQAIDDRADEIVGLAQTILKNPEPGFRETKTSHLVSSKFAELGIPFRAVAQTGCPSDVWMDHGHQLANVSHVGGAGSVSHVANVFLTDQIIGVCFEDVGHVLVLGQRHVARYGLDLHVGAHCHRAGLQRPVYLHVGVQYRFDGAAANKSLHASVGGYCANRFPALGYDWVYPHRIGVLEGLPVEVNGGQCQRRRVQRVDSQVRGAPGVGATADELDLLRHGADYVIEDYKLAVITAAKALTATAVDLLGDGAANAGNIIAGHRPEMTKEEYLKFMRQMASEETFESN